MERTLSRKELAAMAGLSGQRLSQIERDDDGPVFIDGKITLEAAGEWLCAYGARKAFGIRKTYVRRTPAARATTAARLEGEYQLARKNSALADKTELENAARRAELIEATEAEKGWSEIVERVTARLLQIPNTAAPLVVNENDPVTVTEIIDDVIRDALTELSAPI